VRWQAHYQEYWCPLPDQPPDVLQPRAIGYGADRLEGMSDAESEFTYCDADAPCAEIEGQDSPGGPSTDRRVAGLGGTGSAHSTLSASDLLRNYA
jgi:hypothetical protein